MMVHINRHLSSFGRGLDFKEEKMQSLDSLGTGRFGGTVEGIGGEEGRRGQEG